MYKHLLISTVTFLILIKQTSKAHKYTFELAIDMRRESAHGVKFMINNYLGLNLWSVCTLLQWRNY